MSGAIPPLPNTPSRCGGQLKHRDNFTFTFYLTISLKETIPYNHINQMIKIIVPIIF
jgi:hypothetical protein